LVSLVLNKFYMIYIYIIYSFLLPSEDVPAFAGGAGLGVV